MAKSRSYCVPCGIERQDVLATAEVDGDPVCAMHQRMAGIGAAVAAAEKPVARSGHSLLPSAVCSRGCGYPPHRGKCGVLKHPSVLANPNELGGDVIVLADHPVHSVENVYVDGKPVGSLCTRGCGRPMHKGHCKGAAQHWVTAKNPLTALPKPISLLEALEAENRSAMEVAR